MLIDKFKKINLLIIYKLLCDSLFLLLLFLTLTLLAEGLIPGIVSTHFSFLKIILVIFCNLFALYFIGNFLKINIEKQTNNKKTVIFLTVLGVILIFNSLLKLNIFLNIFILLIVAIAGYFIYKNILE